MCSAFRSCFDVYLLVPSLRVGIRIFLLALENAGRPNGPMAPRSEVDVSSPNVDIARSKRTRLSNFPNVIPLDDRSGFFHSRSVGDGQHYWTILTADSSHVFR